MTNKEKREAAKDLYMLNIPGQEIARVLRTSVTSVSTWVTEGEWRLERADSLSKKKNRTDILAGLIDYQLEAIQDRVNASRKLAQDQKKGLVPIDKGEIDALVKMFSVVKGKELTWANVVDIVREFMTFVNGKNNDLAKAMTPYTDEFLMSKREGVTA